MADRTPNSGTGEETRAGTSNDPPARRRSWIKVSGIIGIVVVMLVAIVIFIGGADHGPGMHGPGGDHEGNTPPIAGAPELVITADKLAFHPDRIELSARNPINVAMTSADILHDLVVDEVDFHVASDRNETTVGGLVFDEPGTYVGYCSVPGHREAGMELEIVVTPNDEGGDHTPLLTKAFREHRPPGVHQS